MMTQIAAVIPVCQEEVKCARTAAISACSPATQTFANAIERAMTSANGSSSCASSLRAGDPMRGVGGKKGLIPVQAKAILQDTYLLACMQTHTYSTGEKAPEPERNLMEACTGASLICSFLQKSLHIRITQNMSVMCIQNPYDTSVICPLLQRRTHAHAHTRAHAHTHT